SPTGDVMAGWRVLGSAGRLQETTRGKELGRFARGAGYIQCLAFSGDGKVLVGAEGSAWLGKTPSPLLFWDGKTGRELARFTGEPEGTITALALTTRGDLLASAGNEHKVRLWDVRAGKQVTDFKGHQAAITCLVFAADGKQLASGSEDGTVFVWDVSKWT